MFSGGKKHGYNKGMDGRSRTSTSFAQRMAGNTIEEQCNPHLPLRQPITDTTTKRAKIDVVQSKNDSYRYMFEKIKDKADSKWYISIMQSQGD